MSEIEYEPYESDYQPYELMKDLVTKGYAAILPMSDEPRVRVYIREKNDAGGELTATLRRHGYSPTYPKPYDGEDFIFRVDCEPILWNTGALKNCPQPHWWSEEKRDRILPVSDEA